MSDGASAPGEVRSTEQVEGQLPLFDLCESCGREATVITVEVDGEPFQVCRRCTP